MRLKRATFFRCPIQFKALRIEWTRNDRLDKSNGTAAWPIAKLTTGGETDLRVSTEAHSGVGDKLFAGPLAAKKIGLRWSAPRPAFASASASTQPQHPISASGSARMAIRRAADSSSTV